MQRRTRATGARQHRPSAPPLVSRSYTERMRKVGGSLATAGYLLHADRDAFMRAAVWLGMSLLAEDILFSGHANLYFSPSVAWTVAVAAVLGLVLGLIQLAVAYQRAIARPHPLAP